MKLGLCCLLHDSKTKYKSYTIANLKKVRDTKSLDEAREKIFTVLQHNVDTLQAMLDYCKDNNIESYRVSSEIFPKMDLLLVEGFVTQAEMDSYQSQLYDIVTHDIVLSMHPGQHVNMGSPTPSVIDSSVADLKYHMYVAGPIGCSEINIHVGGAYGDKDAAKKRFISNMQDRFTPDEIKMITIENDELNYSVKDVVEVATELGIRAVYDIHHQRCHELKYPADGTELDYHQWCQDTWEGYGYQRYHISSPRNGYNNISKARAHSDYIEESHVPQWLRDNPLAVVDVEAKHKQAAINKLLN